ncbi:hypothetical protein V2J09_001179 [Rumex salicifolius]
MKNKKMLSKCVVIFLLIQALTTTAERQLRAGAGSPFKVAIFADLHFGENAWTDWGPKQDANSLRVMSNVLDAETPDLVVYLGDLITANNIPIANASMYWDLATSPARERGIPWATIFGNHDDAQFVWPLEWLTATGIPPLNCSSATDSLFRGEEVCGLRGRSRAELMKHEVGIRKTQSVTEVGPLNLWPSVSNYVLEIVSSSCDPQSTVVALLYFMDSGGGSYPQLISKAQADWFQAKSREINPNSTVPEIMFWHIPSKAYKDVAPWFSVRKPCVGSMNNEKVASQEGEFGIMKILETRPSVKAVIVGHNHGLDWCCPYKKLWLCFGRHTGYGGYGRWARGARILHISHRPFSINSWIRMEDGSVHSQLVLAN